MTYKEPDTELNVCMSLATLIAAAWLALVIVFGTIHMHKAQHQFWKHWTQVTVTVKHDPPIYSSDQWITLDVTYPSFNGKQTLDGQIVRWGGTVPQGAKVSGVWENDKNQFGEWSYNSHNAELNNRPGQPGYPLHWFVPAIVPGTVIVWLCSLGLFALVLWVTYFLRDLKEKRHEVDLRRLEERGLVEARIKAEYDAAYNAAMAELENIEYPRTDSNRLDEP